ncbi:MAG: hypothetical protein ABSE92_18050, partial [Terriglobales bacterium]
FAIARKLSEVISEHANVGRAVLIEAGESRGGECRLLGKTCGHETGKGDQDFAKVHSSRAYCIASRKIHTKGCIFTGNSSILLSWNIAHSVILD